VRADRCLNGGCACGDGGVCAAGLECDGGTCQCTPTSCQGCCEIRDGGSNCNPGNDVASCGVAGKPCARCSVQCDAGVCAGECDCLSGCCSGRTCYSGYTRSECGWPGTPCAVCIYEQSDCIDRECRCGTTPPCGFGQFCQRPSDICICTPNSCLSGCCTDAGTCSLGIFQDACGSQGAACNQCDPAQVCQYQQCVLQ
jgi:hypothetical protein